MPAKAQSDRAFGFTIGVAASLLTLVIWLVTGKILGWLLGVAGALMLIAVIWPVFLLPANRMWQRFARRLGLVMNHVVLGIFLYLVMTPIGLIMRLLGHDPLQLRRDEDAESYFVDVERRLDPENLPDLF